MDPISCCIVGYGGIAAFHAEALKQIESIRCHSIVGRRLEPAEAFRDQMGFEKATTDYDECLNDPSVDVVIIASPSELHYDQTARAIEAGKDVLVEIPIAMSQKGARDLSGMAQKSGRKIMIAHTRRFDPAGMFVKDFLASDRAGRVILHQHYSYWLRHENVGWTGYQRSWTDDVLFHHGCHLVDFSLWTIDAPVRRVRGELSPLHPDIGTSMDVSLIIRYANEAIATISLSYNAHQSAIANIFICENGTLSHTGKQVTFNGETVFETELNAEGGVLIQNREFFQAIREDRQPSCNADDGLRALTVLQQVYDQMTTLENQGKYQRKWEL